MKILQVIPSLVAGGAEQAVVDINAALVRRGAQSFVASSGGSRVAAIEQAGGTHYTLPAASKNPLTIIANARQLAAIIRAQGIDLIHARSRAPAWSAWMAARWTGCHFVTTFHAAYAYSNGLKKAYNRVMTQGKRIIAISDFIAAHIRNHYDVPPERVVTIHRGIDLTRFARERVPPENIAALRSLWQIAPEQRVILLPARLSRIKGQDVLLAALRLLAEQGALTSIKAIIIGADQGRVGYVQELMEQIMVGPLRDHVVLADHCQDMPAAYALADVVVAPSRVPEGFGRVPVEAQAMGVPVIATDLGATRETVLPNITGWLIPPDDPVALAEKIEQVLALSAEERTNLARHAIIHARNNFDLVQMAAATLAVYQQVMEDGYARS